ncbi:hypothetical protein RCG19_15260 [Neobacillus sp. OS1-2]|uniref:hypothetical protein n=1 Tax=Neobacillus sp. OS1-2 TaxID=3070680 RepID=UPI0027E1CD9A|nr:hypothetical protein [Neobacillus sp. OS1-2]WML38551.1 hypothetical protein RCG19_15260 [Neobacillus sp. OS1-2]
MEITKHLFLNLSLFIVILFFCLIFLEKGKKFAPTKSSLIIIFIATLWFCIQFSYTPDPFTRYDLRIIPLVLGGLYVGIGPILILALVFLRILYGLDIGFIETTILYIPFAIFFWKVHPWFLKQSPERRIFITICMGMVLAILTVFGMSLTQKHSDLFDAWFAYLVVPSLGIGIISYGIEFVRKNNEMQQQLIKAEKLKAVEQMGAAISMKFEIL